MLAIIVGMRVAQAQPDAGTPVDAAPAEPVKVEPPPVPEPPKVVRLQPPADLPPPGSAHEPRAVAGYDGGMYVATRDDAFHLGISAWLQARYELDRFAGRFDHRFSVPVGRVLLGGHAFSTTDFMLSGDAGTGAFQLVDAYIDQPLGFAKLRFGQLKPVFSQQQLAEEVHLELTERPITYAFAGIGRDLGASLHSEPNAKSGGFEWALGVFDGTGIVPAVRCPIDSTMMEAICDPPTNVPADARPLVAARIGWSSARADAYHEGDLDHDRPRIAIGIGYAVDLAAAQARAMRHDATIDVVVKAEGWSLTTAAFAKSARDMTARRTDFAWHAQLGRVVVPRLLEIAARFAEIRLDATKLHEIAAALDVYRRGHALKWQVHGGALHDTATSTTTWLARVQTQLLF